MAERTTTCIYFIGTAGAGKSTLAGAYKEWVFNRGLDCILVNLDPGAESLPYTPDVDVRDWVNLKDVMRSEGLGPNGAQIAASDMLALNAKKIRDAIEGFKTDYVLVDTPGQIELFVFRPSGKYLTEFLYPESSLVAFLLDPFLAKTPGGFVSNLLLASSVQFRLNLPTSYLLTKGDMLTDEELEKIRTWSQEPDALRDAFMSEEEGIYREMSVDLLRVIDGLGNLPSLQVTSAINLSGLEDLYAHVQQLVAGGEDAMSD